MGILSQSTFSIKRMVNGKTLNFVLTPNGALTQIYTPDPPTYSPDYTKNAMVITPSLLISGQSTDQISHLKAAPTWTINGSSTLTGFGATVGTSSPYALTIKNNLTSAAQLTISCSAVYVEPTTLVEMPLTASMTITKVSNTGTSIRAVAYAPQGQIYKNSDVVSLKAHCDMYRGSTIDATNVSYTWEMLSGGTWTAVDSSNTLGITGYGTNEITIPSSAVVNTAIFRCTCKDTDSSSSTYGISVQDTVSYVDMSDPYDIDDFEPNGDTIVDGGNISVYFKIRQANNYLTSSDFTKTKTIKVYRNTAAGVLDTTWGTVGYKTTTLDSTTGQYNLALSSSDLLSGSVTAFGVQLEG